MLAWIKRADIFLSCASQEEVCQVQWLCVLGCHGTNRITVFTTHLMRGPGCHRLFDGLRPSHSHSGPANRHGCPYAYSRNQHVSHCHPQRLSLSVKLSMSTSSCSSPSIAAAPNPSIGSTVPSQAVALPSCPLSPEITIVVAGRPTTSPPATLFIHHC